MTSVQACRERSKQVIATAQTCCFRRQACSSFSGSLSDLKVRRDQPEIVTSATVSADLQFGMREEAQATIPEALVNIETIAFALATFQMPQNGQDKNRRAVNVRGILLEDRGP